MNFKLKKQTMKKIMFNDKYGLTQAVFEGRKTQTRRIVRESLVDEYDNWLDDVMCIAVPSGTTYEKREDFLIKRSKYKIGEIVAIAQSYEMISSALTYSERAIFYCNVMKSHFPQSATHKEYYEIAGWNNKMFVKAELMPRKIRITNVRLERLQDISDDDCIKEGIIKKWHAIDGRDYYYIPGSRGKLRDIIYKSARTAYAALIDKISGKGTWRKNPYVFVYDFELVK